MITIGRLTLPDPETYRPGTNSVTVSGILADLDDDLSPDQAVFVAEQLAAMGGRGAEVVVPVACDVFEGFYRVDSVDVTPFDGVRYAQGYAEWEVTLSPVLGHEMPTVESVVTGAVRHNTAGIDGSDVWPFHAAPGACSFYEGESGGNPTLERSVEGGTVVLAETSPSTLATWACPADDWYMGACGVDSLVDGEYLPHTGPGSLADTWVMGNGMVQARMLTDRPEFRWWGNDEWSDWVDISPSIIVDPPQLITWEQTRSVRVTPERVTVMSNGRCTPYGDFSVTSLVARCTLTIRRGSPWVDVRFNADLDLVDPNGFSGTFTTEDGYRYETSATDGWRMIVAHPDFDAADTGPNFDPAGKSFGVAASHTSMTGQQTHLQLHDEWFTTQSERTVIGRQL